MKRWYVAHTRPHGEARAADHLRRQDFETFFPVFTKQRRHARRVETVLAPLFPRYLFVALDMATDRWRSINGTVGVDHLVCDGGGPMPVEANIVETLVSEADDRGRVRPAALQVFRAGDRLRVVDGPMLDQTGSFEQLTADERVILLMNVLGRDVRVTVPLSAIDAA